MRVKGPPCVTGGRGDILNAGGLKTLAGEDAPRCLQERQTSSVGL